MILTKSLKNLPVPCGVKKGMANITSNYLPLTTDGVRAVNVKDLFILRYRRATHGMFGLLRINNTNKLFSKTMKITTKILFILIISIILTAQILFFH
jgi:hypothetical protein